MCEDVVTTRMQRVCRIRKCHWEYSSCSGVEQDLYILHENTQNSRLADMTIRLWDIFTK